MIGGCLRRVVALAIIVVLSALVWQYRDPLGAAWVAFRSTEPAGKRAPDDLGAGAEAKLIALGQGQVDRIALPESELQGLVDSRSGDLLPPFIVAPKIEIRSDRLRVRFQVPTDRFPRVEELGEVLGFLPDTTEVVASGQIIPLHSHRIGIAIDELTAARIPLPRGMIPTILNRLGRQDEPGLPPDAFGLELPEGASTAYIRSDSLIFMARPITGS